MAINLYTLKFESICKQPAFRIDPKYRKFWDIEKGILQLSPSKKYVRLGNIISEIPISKIKKGALDNTFNLMSIPNQIPRLGQVCDIEEVTEIDSDKNPLNNADIIISKLGLPKGLVYINTKKYSNFIGSSEFIPYKLANDTYMPKFLMYLLLLPSSLKGFECLETGKTPSHRRVNPFDILNVKIPLIPRDIQIKALGNIDEIEKNIALLRCRPKSPVTIINNAFAKKFNFNTRQISDIRQTRVITSSLLEIAKNIDLRSSYKFHCPSGKYVMQFFNKISKKKVKDFLAEPIVLGASVSPDDYDEDGEYCYVSMASIKNWKFDADNSNKVTDQYYQSNLSKAINRNDIIMARSGEGTIGKVALIEDDIEGIFCDFTMRIKLKDYNPKFAYYYFSTDFFQHLIYVHKKGLGNNTNIFPNQLREFPMLDVPLHSQDKIVDGIQDKIVKQEQVQYQIEKKREEIDKIVLNAITYSGCDKYNKAH